ncbi:MAG: hypothetical protein IIA45_13370 [Bacteroidetes bacterium]|nr:hypothetical protein [Bacteroidota bacterium]
MKFFNVPLLSLMLLSNPATSQKSSENFVNAGSFTGNIQVDFQYYQEDSTIFFLPQQKMGLNSWGEFTYRYQGLTAGLRYEAFQHPLIGYSIKTKGQGIPFRYINYKKDEFEITAGDYYVQFGNGLLLRTYQDRGLGIDNALDGIRLGYTIADKIHLTGISGKPRHFFGKDTSIIRGGDAQIDISDFINEKSKFKWTSGFSYVSRYYPVGDFDTTYPAYVEAYSYRTQIGYKKLNLEGEIARKSTDPLDYINFRNKNEGKVYYINASYATKGLGVSGQYKRIIQFDFRSNPTAQGLDYFLNFLPPIAKFYSLKEFTRYPFTSTGTSEQGIQGEITYSPKIGKTLLLNYSKVHDADWKEKYYESVYVEGDMKISKKLKSIVSYQYLDYDQRLQQKIGKVYAHIFLADLSYRIRKKINLRGEVQYLMTGQDKGDWIYGLLEFTIAPHYSFAVIDEVNLGKNPEIHFYTLSASYSKGSHKFLLTYGRQSEGWQCAGGVCRYIPAYNGAGISVLSNF